MKSKRTKLTSITKKVKEIVWKRDKGRCIFCGSTNANPEAHAILSGAYGGLGVEKNIVTVCRPCHMKMDNSIEQKQYKTFARKYLEAIYGAIKEEEVKYTKYG